MSGRKELENGLWVVLLGGEIDNNALHFGSEYREFSTGRQGEKPRNREGEEGPDEFALKYKGKFPILRGQERGL
jgi:hypothetical protein